MILTSAERTKLPADVCHRALEARDPRFDGVFFVGITTTRIYCRPVCPSRPADPDHRRFFPSAAAAERTGFRPCLRCRPELAPGRALVDSVSRLASAAAQRIAAGALNGNTVASLASDLSVSERHLRRALKRELGVSPIELAQTHRLLLAKRLLADTSLNMTRVAFASGFQSLRRFNAMFQERYRMSPTEIRRTARSGRVRDGRNGADDPAGLADDAATGPIRLTLAYRAPFAWEEFIAFLRREATPGVELIDGPSYGRTVRVDGCAGFVIAEALPEGNEVDVEIAPSLLPTLMPLLAGLRRLFDLDAEPTVVDAHLEDGGLGPLVRRRPGMRVPGAVDGFEVALFTLLRAGCGTRAAGRRHVGRMARALGEHVATGIPGLERLPPTAERVADAGVDGIAALGVADDRARSIVELARLVAGGELELESGSDVAATRKALARIDGVGERLATTITMRALHWPDAFPASDPALQRAIGAANAGELLARAERWRPWRAYAALHLWMHGEGS